MQKLRFLIPKVELEISNLQKEMKVFYYGTIRGHIYQFPNSEKHKKKTYLNRQLFESVITCINLQNFGKIVVVIINLI